MAIRSPLQEWADAVKARDGKCVDCGSPYDLHAHHILPKATHPELKLDVANGKTLCYRCHKAEHARMKANPPRNPSAMPKPFKPHRDTLIKQIEQLSEEIARLTSHNRQLQALVGECDRGVCQYSLRRKKVLAKWAA